MAAGSISDRPHWSERASLTSSQRCSRLILQAKEKNLMNKAQWVLIETGRGSLERVRTAIEAIGRDVSVFSMGDVYENRSIPGLAHVVTYGMHNVAQYASEHYGWLSWIDPPTERCSTYYPRFRDHLVNSDFELTTLGALARDWSACVSRFGKGTDVLFVRPDENNKAFVAEPMVLTDVISLLRVLDPNTMVLVSSCKNIHREWRCFMHGTSHLTGTLYRNGDGDPRSTGVREDVREFAERMGQFRYDGLPPVWVIDVAETDRGLAVLEISDWCVGFYEADHDLIVRAVSMEADLFYNPSD